MQRYLEKKIKTHQSWRGKKYKVQKLERGGGGEIDAWRYVKHVAEPLMWPECKQRQVILMEDTPATDLHFDVVPGLRRFYAC